MNMVPWIEKEKPNRKLLGPGGELRGGRNRTKRWAWSWTRAHHRRSLRPSSPVRSRWRSLRRYSSKRAKIFVLHCGLNLTLGAGCWLR